MDWPRIVAYVTGTVDQELLLRNEYLVAENRILREQIQGRLLLSDAEKKTLAEIGYRLGRKTLEDVGNAATPDTILGWYRKLVAQKFDGSKGRRKVGRPPINDDIEQLIVRKVRPNTLELWFGSGTLPRMCTKPADSQAKPGATAAMQGRSEEDT